LWAIICAAAVVAELLLLFLAAQASRWVIRPMKQLEDSVVELGRSATWNQPLQAGGPPELRRLTHAVEEMGATIQHSIDVQRQMVADSSHQLRNPLASLRLRIDGLAAELRDPASPGFAHVQRDLERLEDVLADLLTLAALESRRTDQSPPDPQDCLVDAVLHEVVETWLPAADSAGITIRLDTTEGLIAAASEHDLRQLLGALVDNAIKYAGRGACVTLTAHPDASGVVITVSDNGHGLSEQELLLATNRFWRGSAPGLGTGLGLAIAEQTALAVGGSLELTRTDPHGLTAVVRLEEAP
jgi:signal transduction histidine kinase